MSLTTFFQFTETSYLPLPPPNQRATPVPSSPIRETDEQIRDRGIKTAIEMLHSPELMITLNPLVQHYSRIQHDDPETKHRLVKLQKLATEFNVKLAPQDSCATFAHSENGEFVHYEITDKFQFLGGLTSKLMVYRACFRPLYDESVTTDDRQSIGLETISDPGSGVALLGQWTVSEDERKPGFLRLTETVKVHCNVFLGWYVRSQLESAHAALHKDFGRAFAERMVANDPAKDMGKAGKTWKEREHEELQRTGSDISPTSRTSTLEAKRHR